MNLKAADNLNYQTICRLPNCGGIVAKYTYYYLLTHTSGSAEWLDIDLSLATTFTLEVFAC